MNKPTCWPKRLRRCIHLAYRIPLQNAKQLLRINFVRKEYPLLQSWVLINLGLVYSMARDVSVLPRVEELTCFRFITGQDYLQDHLLKIGLADALLCPLCKSVPITQENLFDCFSLLHVLSHAVTHSGIFRGVRGRKFTIFVSCSF
ncbi:hypothetical protein TNCV_306951 [Trichonephila clavipes]|nr:hypothetical protein TNCV_306951 [Trichonephila clavipes]